MVKPISGSTTKMICRKLGIKFIKFAVFQFARGHFDGRHYKSSCESITSDCSDVISSLSSCDVISSSSSSLAGMKTDETLFVKNRKRRQELKLKKNIFDVR